MTTSKLSVGQVRAVLGRFSSDEHGTFMQGAFADYPSDVGLGFRMGRFRSPADRIARNLMHASDDLWNVGVILHRLEWTRAECLRGNLPVGTWSRFAEVDIEHFHVEIRSALDYLAKAIVAAAPKPGQTPDGSFNKLGNWIKRDANNRVKIGEQLAALVEAAPWFPSVRGIRNATVHDGARTAVFHNPEEGISFQVHSEGFRNLINEPVLMFNANVVDFQLYAALLITDLLSYLDRVAETLCGPLVGRQTFNAKLYSSGFPIYLAWASRLLLALERDASS